MKTPHLSQDALELQTAANWNRYCHFIHVLFVQQLMLG